MTQTTREKQKSNTKSSNGYIETVSPIHLCAYFKRDKKLVTHRDKYRWVPKVLQIAPFNKTRRALELKLGQNNINVQFKTKKFQHVTTIRAAGEILEKKCMEKKALY